MSTAKLMIATVLAVAALGVNAQTRMESPTSPFTYEALSATPSLKFGKGSPAAKASSQRPDAKSSDPARQANGMFTYDAIGATPHVELKRPAPVTDVPLQPAGR
jgi:hypothetical protein